MSGELSLHGTTPREPLARHAPSMTLKPGITIGGYLVLSQLGVGGMGKVFLAEDKALARKVALKILPPEDSDEEGRARFLREAQALARVQHKNVVQVFASGVDEDVAWMALEYVEGDPLGALVDGVTGVDEETAVSLCAQAARGLAAVHAVGVVHRDVKPDNLLLDADANVRVLDFGVALFVDRGGLDGVVPSGKGGFVTQKGVAVGTPHYMAPEQARGGAIDASADAWGLGATLYTLLAGRPPFYSRDDEADLDILARVLRERAPDVRQRAPAVSAATASLVVRMLEPDREQRLADMETVAALCDEIADALASGGPVPPPVVVAPAEASAPSVSPLSEPSAPVTTPSAPATTTTTTSARPSIAGVVAVALLFAGLGALIAGQVAQRMIVRDDSPPTQGRGAVTSVDVTPPVAPVDDTAPPVPVDTAPPVPGEVASPPVDDEPPAPPTAEELQSLFIADPEARGPLWELLERKDEASKAALARLAAMPGKVGDTTVEVVVGARSREHIAALQAAVMQSDRARAELAINALVALRPFEALEILDKAAASHEDKQIRAKARSARQELFRVE